jgi:glycerate 2-kinase
MPAVGRGSALLADKPAGVSFEEWTAFSKALVNSGASIVEINAVRKHLSGIKGGQLARVTWPAHLVCLALSDVIGDPLDVIASGPSVADPTTFADAMEVLRRRSLDQATPQAVMDHLIEGSRGALPETPKAGDECLSRATNVLIGSNTIALKAALGQANEMGLAAEIITTSLQGACSEAARYVLNTAREKFRSTSQPGCLLFGGETTLRVAGQGKGGRNQHFALTCAKLLHPAERITILAAGTDGNDGPTDAAGAIVDASTWTDALHQGTEPQAFLDGFDSFNFFARFGGHVMTGPTMTNVMDLVVLLKDAE